MAPPSKLDVAISSVNRLLKEKASYHKEEEAQVARIHKLEQETSGENLEFMLKQEVLVAVSHTATVPLTCTRKSLLRRPKPCSSLLISALLIPSPIWKISS